MSNKHNTKFQDQDKIRDLELSQIYYHLQLWKKNSRDFKKRFEIAVVNKPSVFEPSKFQCIKQTHPTVLEL